MPRNYNDGNFNTLTASAPVLANVPVKRAVAPLAFTGSFTSVAAANVTYAVNGLVLPTTAPAGIYNLDLVYTETTTPSAAVSFSVLFPILKSADGTFPATTALVTAAPAAVTIGAAGATTAISVSMATTGIISINQTTTTAAKAVSVTGTLTQLL